jgi:hypothetical protein
MVIVRDFSGGLDMDSHAPRVGRNNYVDSLNITHNAKNKAGSIFHLVGNRVVAFAMPTGTNVCIGAKADVLRNRIIFFNWNSAGNHFIAKFDKDTRTITKILEDLTDTNDIAVLNFQRNFRVNDIDIIHRDEDGDLLFFNDAYNAPFGFNIDTISDYIAGGVTDDLVHLAKRPPLDPPTPVYASDENVEVNSLRNKLFQFKYRWVYKDGYKSTWSPISKVVLPISGYSVVTDTNPSENNVIEVQLNGGGADYQKIEISMRESNGTTWGDFYLVDSLDRDDYSISPEDTYTYNFYNDGAYTVLNQEESDLLYSYIPPKANTQSIVDGKYIVYAGITEGYDTIPRSEINVQLSTRLIDTSPNETPTSPPSLTYTTLSTPSGSSPTDYKLFLYIGASVSGGCVYHAGFITSPISGVSYTLNAQYIALNTDTVTDVRSGLIAAIDAQLGPNFTVQVNGADSIKIETNVFPSVGGGLYNSINVYAVGPSATQGSTSVWKWNSRYRFGIVYYDKYGRTNGVISFVTSESDVTDFAVVIPDFAVYSGNSYAPRIAVVTASIGHEPPEWAVSMQWVRTKNLSVAKYVQYITCQVDLDDDYIYLCIANLDQFKLDNTGFVPSYDFVKGDRVRVMTNIDTSDSGNIHYSESYTKDDYEVIGVVSRPVTAAGVDGVGRFLKVRRPSIAKTYSTFQLIEIYTPALRSRDDEQVFYEFGQSYQIYTDDDGNRLHTGSKADQTLSQPAQYEFREGDDYFKFRRIYSFVLAGGTGNFIFSMMDANYADYWSSAVSSNGRPLVIDENAKQVYDPALIRFSQAYEEGTSINAINIFYPLNYIRAIRDYGDIKKIFPWNNDLIVCQKFKIGHSPVFQTVVQYVNGQDTVVSDRLLNPVQYFKGQYGVGDYANSVVVTESAIYFWDSNRKINCRISQSGIDPISKQNNANAYANQNCVARNVHGVYDSENDVYMTFFDVVQDVIAATAIAWNERRKSYESKLSLDPEMACEINGLVCTWKNGALWTHDDEENLNSFFGTVYESYVVPVFNDEGSKKKVFENLTLLSGAAWDVPTMETNVKSYLETVQASYLKEASFVPSEGEFHAAIPPDSNSPGARVNGAAMKGQWLKAKIRKEVPTVYSYLSAVILNNEISPKSP